MIGGAELGFSLGFDRPLVDDIRIGYYSGKRPAFIVVDDRYREWFDQYPSIAPDVSRYVTDMLTNRYVKVYERAPFVVYEQRAAR